MCIPYFLFLALEDLSQIHLEKENSSTKFDLLIFYGQFPIDRITWLLLGDVINTSAKQFPKFNSNDLTCFSLGSLLICGSIPKDVTRAKLAAHFLLITTSPIASFDCCRPVSAMSERSNPDKSSSCYRRRWRHRGDIIIAHSIDLGSMAFVMAFSRVATSYDFFEFLLIVPLSLAVLSSSRQRFPLRISLLISVSFVIGFVWAVCRLGCPNCLDEAIDHRSTAMGKRSVPFFSTDGRISETRNFGSQWVKVVGVMIGH